MGWMMNPYDFGDHLTFPLEPLPGQNLNLSNCSPEQLQVDSMFLESPDRSELHSENKHFKSCLLVVLRTDLAKHEFRLFTNRHHDVVISEICMCLNNVNKQ